MPTQKKIKVKVKKQTDDDIRISLYDPLQIDVGWRARSDMGDLDELCDSIKECGQLQPILVSKNGNKKPLLIAGYRRMQACKKLGIKVRAEIVIPKDTHFELKRQLHENFKRKDFDPLEAAAGLERLKKLYESEHPETKRGAPGRKAAKSPSEPLIAESAKLKAPRFTIVASKEMGCSERRVQELLAINSLPKKYKKEIEQAKTTHERNKVAQECFRKVREDNKLKRLKEQAEAKRQKSIEDQLAGEAGVPSIVLHYGDNKDFMKGEELYDVILTDPPYDREKSLISHVARASINLEKHSWDGLEIDWVLRAAPMLAKGGHLLVFCPLEAIGAYELVCKAAELEYRQCMIWIKTNPAPTHRPVYASAVEALIWAVKPGKVPYFNPKFKRAGAGSINVFSGPSVPGSANDRIHPTQKPEWLITELLNIHAAADFEHRVLDPFAGGATTGVVCKKLKLACTMIENDEDYVKKARIRLDAVG